MYMDTISLVFPKPEQKEHESGEADGANDSAVALKTKNNLGPVQSLETRKSVIVSLVDGVIKVSHCFVICCIAALFVALQPPFLPYESYHLFIRPSLSFC